MFEMVMARSSAIACGHKDANETDPCRTCGFSRHLWAPRIHVDLAAKGIRVGRKRVARRMSAAGLAGVSRRKFVHTTVKGSGCQAPDLVDRNGSCPAVVCNQFDAEQIAHLAIED